MSSPSIVWFQQDLRLSHQPALQAALARKCPILPVYIWASHEESPWEMGAASKWWLHHSLKALEAELREHGLSLIILKGDTCELLEKLIKRSNAGAFFWNRRYEPCAVKREKKIEKMLISLGCEAEGFHGSVLLPPDALVTSQGSPYQVFTPFWRSMQKEAIAFSEKKVPAKMAHFTSPIKGCSIQELELLPKINWDKSFYEQWTPGEAGARKQLRFFSSHGLDSYSHDRDFPAIEGTSLLSAALHFGELSVHEIWHAADEPFRRQLAWRDFATQLLFHFPDTPLQALRTSFDDFPWKKNRSLFDAWTSGQTGIPIIDAGMRQLWKTGWMHNRVRMIVASFLVKNLNIPWQEGARWFWDTLVDADLANNTFGWQWSAGCGADAAPYFRIFNPILQGKRFDPEGEYVRFYVPELKNISNQYIHCPHLSPSGPPKNYPMPIVDLDESRDAAQEMYAKWNRKMRKS